MLSYAHIMKCNCNYQNLIRQYSEQQAVNIYYHQYFIYTIVILCAAFCAVQKLIGSEAWFIHVVCRDDIEKSFNMLIQRLRLAGTSDTPWAPRHYRHRDITLSTWHNYIVHDHNETITDPFCCIIIIDICIL